MTDDPRGTAFEPRYHWLVRIGLVLPVLFGTAVAGSAIVLHGSLTGALIAVGIFILPPLFGFGYVLWYRRIEFRQDELYLDRAPFGARNVAYEELGSIGPEGVEAGDRRILWAIMSNGDELEARFHGLAELDSLQGEGITEEEGSRAQARRKAMTICVGVFTGLSGGLAAAGMALDTTLLVACVGTGLSYLALERILSPEQA